MSKTLKWIACLMAWGSYTLTSVFSLNRTRHCVYIISIFVNKIGCTVTVLLCDCMTVGRMSHANVHDRMENTNQMAFDQCRRYCFSNNSDTCNGISMLQVIFSAIICTRVRRLQCEKWIGCCIVTLFDSKHNANTCNFQFCRLYQTICVNLDEVKLRHDLSICLLSI